jgi:oligopeptide transport system permease protein
MFLLRRALFLIPLLLVISVLSFALLRLAPGGPFDHERAAASPEIERLLRERYHLDDPVWKQYVRWLGDALHGDLGLSLKYRNHTVNDIIRQGLPVSLSLGLLAFGFAMGVGVPVGFYTAVRRGHWADWGGSFLVLLSICVPGFVVGPLLVMLFAIKLRWFPAALWGSPTHAVLPMITLGLYFAGRVARLMREGMTQTLQSEFIRTARAKGLGEFAVLTRHAFRLAVMPVVSYSGPMLADLLTGSFVVESIFQIPGIGVFIVDSSRSRDYPLVIGLVLLYAVLLLGLNLLVDLAYGQLDPRVKYE